METKEEYTTESKVLYIIKGKTFHWLKSGKIIGFSISKKSRSLDKIQIKNEKNTIDLCSFDVLLGLEHKKYSNKEKDDKHNQNSKAIDYIQELINQKKEFCEIVKKLRTFLKEERFIY